MFRWKTIFIIIGILLIAVFALFSREVKRGLMARADFDVTVKLQDKIPPRFDELMDDGAILADGVVSSVIVLGLTAWGLVTKKGIRRKAGVLILPLAFVAVTAMEIYGKNVLPHPGPPFFMIKRPTTIFPKFHVVQPYAYPSGHAARSTFLGIILVSLLASSVPQRRERRRRWWVIGGIVGYVGFVYLSRIYLGHHWLSDIVGGALLGGGLGILTVALL